MQGSGGDKDSDESPENMEKESRILPGGKTEDLVGRSDLSRAWLGSKAFSQAPESTCHANSTEHSPV